MTLPIFWRRAAFSVAESADILCVPQDTLRTWMAREPTGDFLGAKTGSRVFLSGNDLFFYSLIREFTTFGVPVRTAMHTAHPIASFCNDQLPPTKYIVVRTRSTFREFEETVAPDITKRPSAVIPLRTLAERLIERCEPIFETAGR